MPLRTVSLLRRLSAALVVLAALLAGCRGVAPLTAVTPSAGSVPSTPASPALQAQAVPLQATVAAAPVQTPAATETPLAVRFRLELPEGWELAGPDDGYAFTALWRAAATSEPAAIATGLLVPADGLDLPALVDATASELQRVDGTTVLSAQVDGLLRQDSMPAGVLRYTLASHEQLGDLPHGRQILLAAPAADAFMAVTCLISAQAPRDAAQLCDALANAIVFD